MPVPVTMLAGRFSASCSVRGGVRWEGGSPIDERIWVVVSALIDPAEEAAIRRDIDSIAGATVQD